MFKKILTAIRGGVNEAGEAIVDSQGMRILTQEIRESKAEVDKAESQLAKVIADSKRTEVKVETAKAQYNDYAAKLEKIKASGDTELAAELQSRMQSVLADHNENKAVLEQQNKSVTQLKNLLTKNRKSIESAERQIGVLKTQESLNSAKSSLVTNSNSTNSRLSSMSSTMEKMKEKQAHRAAELDALETLEADASGASLDAKLDAAGFGDSVKVEDLPSSL